LNKETDVKITNPKLWCSFHPDLLIGTSWSKRITDLHSFRNLTFA